MKPKLGMENGQQQHAISLCLIKGRTLNMTSKHTVSERGKSTTIDLGEFTA